MRILTITVPGLWTAEGVTKTPGRVYKRVHGIIGSRKDVARRIADRKANGEAFPGERPVRVTLALRYDGSTVHATDLGGA